MELSLKLEYYPKLPEEMINEAISMISERKDRYNKPFFTDTSSYLDLDNIKQVSEQFLLSFLSWEY